MSHITLNVGKGPQVMPWYMLMSLLVFSTAATLCAAGAEKWQRMGTIRPGEYNHSFSAQWDPQAGVRLRIGSTQDKAQNLFFNIQDSTFSVSMGPTREEATVLESARLGPENLPGAHDPDAQILLKVRHEGWWLYLNNMPVLWIRPNIALPATLDQPVSQTISEKLRMESQKIGEFTFTAGFMGADTEKRDILKDWEQLKGNWRVWTAWDDTLDESGGTRHDRKEVDANYSSNFYSVMGSGKGQMLSGYGFEDNYEVRTSLQLGMLEGGLVFYHQDERNYYTLGFEAMHPQDTKATLKLVRHSSVKMPRVKELMKLEIDTTSGQWMMLAVRAWNQRIECYLDNHKLFDMDEDLPTNGRYGLYVNQTIQNKRDGLKLVREKVIPRLPNMRFDDFAAESVTDLELRTVSDIRFNTIASHNSIYDEDSALLRFFRPRNKNMESDHVIDSSISGNSRWIAIGSPYHPDHTFGTSFAPRSSQFAVGLLFGFKTKDQPHYQVVAGYDGDNLNYRLEKVSGATSEVVADEKYPIKSKDVPKELALKVVTDGQGVVRLFADEVLVLVAQVDAQATQGASGIYLGPGTKARLSDFQYYVKPRMEYVNKFEKSRLFSKDEYMLHWSSPEGEWFTDPRSKETWHKSDFFGGYTIHMPLVPKSTIHPGLLDGQRFSPVHLRVNTGRELELMVDGKVLKKAPLPKKILADAKVSSGGAEAYALHCEGHSVWVESDGNIILSHHMKEPFKGTRVRIEGFSKEQLKHSHVIRNKIKDFLFTEATHDWTVTDGDWQVTNRFGCRKEWSHLNGESIEGVAAMWGKYQFSGDFCVEAYVGLRQESGKIKWYSQPGRDFNITVMNSENRPGSGYTATCTGWDPNESQTYTRLYRNGEEVATTDIYTAPRYYAGNRRKSYESVIKRNRDIHGAWYYIKIRRIGNLVEYYFDNEKVLSYDDPNPINLGSLGLWTYRCSMMVARVKIAARQIAPKPVVARNVTHKSPPKELGAVTPFVTSASVPLQLNRPSDWETDVLTSHGTLSWQGRAGQEYAVFDNQIGAGTMKTAARLAPMPLEQVAGLQFQLKHTRDAKFNFHYTVGHMINDKFEPLQRYYHRISGTDLDTSDCKLWGETILRPSRPGRRWHSRGDWQDVTVWFPAQFDAGVEQNKLFVQIEGFGNLNPSYIQQGLHGNAIGEGYAFRGFAPIMIGAPELTASAPEAQRDYMLIPSERGHSTVSSPNLDAIIEACAKDTTPGVKRAKLRVREPKSATQTFLLSWLQLPDSLDADIQWHPEEADALLISCDFPDPQLRDIQVTADAHVLPVQETEPGKLIARLVRPYPASDTIEVSVSGSGGELVKELAFADQKIGSRPILAKLSGPVPLLASFETPSSEKILETKAALETDWNDDMGRFMVVRNRTAADRLRTEFDVRQSMARFPIMQFRYRTEHSARISLQVLNQPIVFNEKQHRSAQHVRFARGAEPDGKWHTWHGMIPDASRETPFDVNLLRSNSIIFGSLHSAVQTGRYSEFAMDDLVLGPAVRHAEGLTMTPSYTCPKGVEKVEYAILEGETAFADLPPAKRINIKWDEVQNGAAFTPELGEIEDGFSHLLLRAHGANNRPSQVTDLPFLLDRHVPSMRQKVLNGKEPGTNGTMLQLTFPSNGGAPIDLERLRFTCNGKEVTPDTGTSKALHTRNSDTLTINWPLMLREQIQANSDNQRLQLMVSGITDGAGNQADDVQVTLPVNTRTNKIGPAIDRISFSKKTNILMDLTGSWLNSDLEELPFKGSRGSRVKRIQNFNESPFVRSWGGKNSGYIWQRVENNRWWDLNRYPYLSVALRIPGSKVGMRVNMVVKTTKGLAVTIPLMLPSSDSLIDRKVNDWQTFTFNAKERFAQAVGAKAAASHQANMWQISLISEHAKPKQQIEIRDLVVYNDWSDTDSVDVSAYDMNGIREYVWEHLRNGRVVQTGSQDSSTFYPSRLVQDQKGWIHITAVDRVGNSSRVIRIPLGPEN